MTHIVRPFAFVLFAARRLLSYPGPVIGTAVGLLVTVTLAMSIPLYTEAADYRLLRDELRIQQAGYVRPPFAFKFRYPGYVQGALPWQSYADATPFFAELCPDLVGLPLQFSVYHVATGLLRIYPTELPATMTETQAIDFATFAFVTGMDAHIEIVEGAMPAVQPAGGSEPLQVLVLESRANEVGFTIGEEVNVRRTALGAGSDSNEEIRVRVVGVWRPRDPAEGYWFNQPTDLAYAFLVPPESFENRVVPVFSTPVYEAVWYLVFDGSSIRPAGIPAFIERIKTTRAQMTAALPKSQMDLSPEVVMLSFTERAQTLLILMLVFAIPVVFVILYFIVFLSNLIIMRQRNEIAVLRSRGASHLQVGGLYVVERLLLGALALAAGIGLAPLVAQAMGAVRSFLVFAPGDWLSVVVSRRALAMGVAGVAVSLLASVIPALHAARQSIVSHKQDVARSLHRPAWQRFYLDVALLAVSLYGYYMLRQRGTISFLGQSRGAVEGDPFSNPLLFLVPTIFVFALALIFVRLLPALLDIVGRVQVAPPWLLLALRQLGRSREQYSGPLILIVLTLGLACLSASMAKTLDQALVDRSYYEVGADARIREAGELKGDPGQDASAVQSSSTQKQEFPRFLPVSEHLGIPGVRGVTRLGQFGGTIRLNGQDIGGTIVGIDRLSFPSIAYFRADFAPDHLVTLMNHLAVEDQAALVSSAVLQRYSLRIGDTITAYVVANEKVGAEVALTIVGVTDLFPTIYPDNRSVFAVTNLDYLFERLGGEYAHDILLRTAPDTPAHEIASAVLRMGIDVRSVKDARAMIVDAQTEPERQGIMGLLSIGFLVSALLTVLGYLFYTLLSFERRQVELGVLRAIGLSEQQMAAYLACEQALLLAVSVAVGTGIGVLTSRLFIPFFQVRSGAHPQIPPFVVDIAWTDLASVYAIFGIMFLAAIAGLVWRLKHMRLASAIKMGEVV